MNANSVYLIDSEGNLLNTKDLMRMVNKSHSYVSELIRVGKIKTLTDFVDRCNLASERNRHTRYIKDKNGDCFSVRNIAVMIGMSHSWVANAYREHGCKTVEDLIEHKDSPKIDGTKRKVTRPPDFDRGKTCFRFNYHCECNHYRSCTDARMLGDHHERYKPDGSCFICDNLDEYIPVPENSNIPTHYDRTRVG